MSTTALSLRWSEWSSCSRGRFRASANLSLVINFGIVAKRVPRNLKTALVNEFSLAYLQLNDGRNFTIHHLFHQNVTSIIWEACAEECHASLLYKRLLNLCQFIRTDVAMAGQPKLFHSLRQLYQTLGSYSPENNQIYPFKWKIIFITVSDILMFIALFAFFLWEAKTVDDYGTSFYECMMQLGCMHNFLVVVWRLPVIFKLLKHFEDFIEASKKLMTIVMTKMHWIYRFQTHLGSRNPVSQTMYNELTAKIEKLFQFLDIFMVKMSLYGVTIPPLLNTAINYFVNDLTDESFELSRPMMCVEWDFS